jgi:hypothetical protein
VTPDDAATFFVRLCLCGPLLYIGLAIAIDPASLGRWAEALARELRTFEQRLKGVQWQEPLPEPGLVHCSPTVRNAVRFAGLVLIAFAFLHLVGLAT